MTANRDFLRALYDAAVAAAQPDQCLPPHLPRLSEGRVILLAAGKAAASMTAVAERFYLEAHRLPPDRFVGLAVTRHGYGTPTRHIPVVEAGHPVPDDAGVAATARALALARSAGAADLVLVLLSGGGSANWIAPAGALTLAEKQAVTRACLRSGAAISEINCLRKHLSRLKGGRLAEAAAGAGQIVTLAISDVPGDDLSAIASGPTVPDPTTLADARAIVDRYALDVPDAARTLLDDPANETPKAGAAAFARARAKVIATPRDALDAAAAVARAAGYEVVDLGADVEGEARDAAAAHAALAIQLKVAGRRAVILSGGELTVTIAGAGRGGPNQEYALALARAIEGADNISAVAGDTDGTDGGGGAASDPAGAFVDGETIARARVLGINADRFLEDNDSTGFFERLGDLLQPGPTFTNVNDIRAICVER